MSKHSSNARRNRRRVLIAGGAVVLGAAVGLPVAASAAPLDNPHGGQGHHDGQHDDHGSSERQGPWQSTPAAPAPAPAAPAPAPGAAAPAPAPAAPAPAPAPAAPAPAPEAPVAAPPAVVAQPALVLPETTLTAAEPAEQSPLAAIVGTGLALASVGGFAWLLASGRPGLKRDEIL